MTTQPRRGREATEAHPGCYTREDLARLLQVSTKSIDRMVALKQIPGVLRLGLRLVRFNRAAIDRWLDGAK